MATYFVVCELHKRTSEYRELHETLRKLNAEPFLRYYWLIEGAQPGRAKEVYNELISLAAFGDTVVVVETSGADSWEGGCRLFS